MFLPKFVLKGNLQAPPSPGMHGVGVTCAPRGAQGQSRHMHTSHVFYATRVSSVLQLKAPAAPENEGPALSPPCLTKYRLRGNLLLVLQPTGLCALPARFSLPMGAEQADPPAQAGPAPKCSRYRPMSCTGGRAPPPQGCAPRRTGTGVLGQHLHPGFNRDELCNPSPAAALGMRGG